MNGSKGFGYKWPRERIDQLRALLRIMGPTKRRMLLIAQQMGCSENAVRAAVVRYRLKGERLPLNGELRQLQKERTRL